MKEETEIGQENQKNKFKKNENKKNKKHIEEGKNEDEDDYQEEDEEEEEDDNNSYEKDSFIVSDDDYEDEDDEDYDEKKKPKKIKNKKRTKVIEDELNSEDEYVLQTYKDKNRRLQKISKQKNFSVEEDQIEESPIEEKEQEEEEIKEGELKFKDFFEPQVLIDNYETELDQKILESDIPERLFFRYQNDINIENKEMIEETNWIVKQMLVQHNLLENNIESLQVKVLKILEFLKLFHYEIMYIWYHKSHEFTSYDSNCYELKLYDLWFIYDMDLKWNEISKKKKQIQKLLDIITKKLEIPQNQILYFLNFQDSKALDYLEEYLDYQFNKLFDDFEIKLLLNQENSSIKKISKRNLAREIFKNKNIYSIAYQISLLPEKLAENIQNRAQLYKPINIQENVDMVANNYTQSEIYYLSDPIRTLKTICEFIAKEYFSHPIIKMFLKKLFTERISIHTEPTDKGKKMNIYNYYYPTKRIKDKKPNNIDLELWLLMLESEEKGLIEIQLNFGRDKDSKKQEMIETISQYVLESPNKTSDKRSDWDIVRLEIVKKLVNEFVIPYFKKDLRKELTDMAKKHLMTVCGREFRTLIDMKPYRKNEPVKVLACTMDEKENAIFGIINEDGYLISFLTLFNILKKPKENDHSQKILYQKDREDLSEFIKKHLPDTVIMSPESMRSYNLKIDELSKIIDDVYSKISDKEKPFDMWTNLKISKIYARSVLSERQNPDLTLSLRELLSMGRYVQNPLAETLNLWSEDVNENILLYIIYHPQQKFLNKNKLKNHLENIILELVNSKGVDINTCLKFPHLAKQLQFVCGLGPRKSKMLLEKIENSEIGNINERRDLENTFMDKNIYENCAAFIKVSERLKLKDIRPNEDWPYNWLDFTRIHPQNYHMAIKISKEALDNPNLSDQGIILKIFKDGSKIEELDLDDFAKHLTEHNKCNMHKKINFIKEELINPFKDHRKDFNTKFNDDDIFYALTNEAPYYFKEESILTVKLVSIEEKGLKVVTNNGLLGFVASNDITDNEGDYKPSEFKNKYKIGDFLRAKIKNINFQQIKVKFSIRTDDLTNHKEYLRRNNILKKYDLLEENNFTIIKEDDFPVFSAENKKKMGKFVPRKINHPNFKNVGLVKALDFLFDRNQGVFLFRPSSKGTDYINLTWKYYGDIIVHLTIKEGHKSAKEAISSTLILDKQNYESLDEIIENYIKPCNYLVMSISQYPKFLNKPIDYVKDNLKEKRAQNQSKIPYYFSFVEEKPQFLILSYILEKRVKHELIKIKADGLYFHSMSFSNLPLLTKYFKENLKTEEYQNFVKRLPVLELGKQKTQISIKEEVKEEYDNKHKRRYKEEDGYRDRQKDKDRHRDRKDRDRGRYVKNEYDDRDRYKDYHDRRRDRDYDDRRRDKDWDRRRDREHEDKRRDKDGDRRRDRDEDRRRDRDHDERRNDGIKKENIERNERGGEGINYSPFTNDYNRKKDDIPDIKFEQA